MAGYAEIFIDQGTDFATFIQITDATTGLPSNILGYSVFSQLRISPYTANASANFACSIVDSANGNVSLTMTAANTSSLTNPRYSWDVRAISPLNTTIRVVEGVVIINPSVSR